LPGGHIRVGFESELLPHGERAADNEALIVAVRTAVTALGLKVATADEFKAQW
jgi:uncharacterized protein (DUF849 family)